MKKEKDRQRDLAWKSVIDFSRRENKTLKYQLFVEIVRFFPFFNDIQKFIYILCVFGQKHFFHLKSIFYFSINKQQKLKIVFLFT